MQKLGIYGGTFDPVHHAHLILARDALEQLQLERVIFVPAALSPHKLQTQPTPAIVRLEMLRAAIAAEERFAIDECELHRRPPSFTIDTVEHLHREAPEAQLFYLIGSDNLPRLDTWHRFAELRRLVHFVVLERGATPPRSEFPTIHRQIDVSATEIRKRVASGLSVRYLVPSAVEEIIRRHNLYQEQTRSPQKN